jgi:2-oxoglutarate dehydrogenase E2 component (dihydrolipoamide succinyltransferase)
MAIELKIPSVGESITEVQIAEWLKRDGDEVKKDENVAVLDSEKTTLELTAPENGRLKILHQAGDMVKVGETVAQIESNGETQKPESKKVETEKPPVAPKQAEDGKIEAKPQIQKAKQSEQKVESKKEKPKAPTIVEAEKEQEEAKTGRAAGETPVVKEIESKKTATLPDVTKSATPKNEQSQPTEQSVSKNEKIVPMTMLRRTAAKRLVEAKQQMAMLTTFNEVDMSAVQNLRKSVQEKFEKRYEVKLGFMSIFVKAVAGALKEFPQLNAEIRGNDIVYHNRFDIGVAIASDRGLVVPVLREADKMNFAEIEKAIADFAKRSREGKLKPQELEGGTFTITNGGVFGSLLSTPIINPPQTGILGMHSIQERPIALNGQVVIRPMMFLALTYDHRLVDGREAVLFLRGVKEAIDNPARMLIEI